MVYFPYFETELHLRYSDKDLIVRNICHPGDTSGFRPHSSRETQWAFPGAEAFHPYHHIHTGIGHYPYPDEWLSMLEADTILAFFGYNESFDGIEHADRFYYELDALVKYTLDNTTASLLLDWFWFHPSPLKIYPVPWIFRMGWKKINDLLPIRQR